MAAKDTSQAGTSPWRRQMHASEKVRLTGEILRAYVRARLMMRTDKLIDSVERMRAVPVRETVDSIDTRAAAVRLSMVATRVLVPLPTDTRCLARSLVVSRLLARRGIEATLVVAVRPSPDFGAHAWVEVDERPVLPPGDAGMERLVEV